MIDISLVEWDRRMTEWDEAWPSFKAVREAIKTRYTIFEPLVLREFRAMDDAWVWQTFLHAEDRVLRLEYAMPNLNVLEPEIGDPQEILDAYERQINDYCNQ